MPLKLEIVTPERAYTTLQVESVTAPGSLGEFCVLSGHRPMLAGLDPGEVLAIDSDGQKHLFAVGGGFAEVGLDRALLMVDSCLAPGEINVARAEAARKKADGTMAGRSTTDPEYLDARSAARRAEVRIKVARSA